MWTDRMQRIEAAELGALGFHEPNRLADERGKAVASAAAYTPNAVAEARARGARMVAAIVASHVLGGSVDDRLIS